MIKGPAFRDGAHNKERMEWWLSRYKTYPFHAEAPVSVKPDIVPGDHASVVLKTGWRTFGFKTDSERVTFCMQFGGRPIHRA